MAYDYSNPNYDEWGRQAIDRINALYSGAGDQINALRQQTRDFNAGQQAGLNRDLMLRYADLQRSVNAGSADLAGQGIRPSEYGNMQLQALQNAANAQNAYSNQQRQMYENMTNDRLAGIEQSRAAFQQGIWGDVNQAKMAQAQAAAAARSGGGGRGGGGGGSGSGSGSGFTDSEIAARMRLLNSSGVGVERGLDWLKTNYGMSSGTLGQVYQSLQRHRGSNAQQLLDRWGARRMIPASSSRGARGTSTSSRMDYVNPRIVQMLQDFIAQRDRYHNAIAAKPFTWEDAVASLMSGQ